MALEPITRTEKLMAGQQLEPITRKEFFLAKAAGMDVKTPEPITREEMFLNMITGGGGTPGGGGGGSTASVPWNDVTFIDYDGTVLHSYTLEEAQALTELPPLPEQKGLICQGWNWSLEDIKAQNGPVIVGATYITDDGKTRIYITLQEGRTSPMLGVCVNGTVTVDWGDGTEPDVLTGTSVATSSPIYVKWTPNHEYAKAGDYVISLSVDGTMAFYGSNTSNVGSSIIRHASEADRRNNTYQTAVKKIEIGNGVPKISMLAFCYFYSLASITIPDGVTSIDKIAFQSCFSLASVVFPNGITSFDNNVLSYCHTLKSVSIPKSVKTISNAMFNYCYSLSKISITEGVTTIDQNAFIYCHSLVNIKIPGSVTSIGSYAFNGCYGARYYDFSACTSVPTLGATSAFQSISDDCQMLIPSALFDEWSTATNWATYASYMVAV
jgi:hypothetical protein